MGLKEFLCNQAAVPASFARWEHILNWGCTYTHTEIGIVFSNLFQRFDNTHAHTVTLWSRHVLDRFEPGNCMAEVIIWLLLVSGRQKKTTFFKWKRVLLVHTGVLTMDGTFTVRQCDRSGWMQFISAAAFPSRSVCLSPWALTGISQSKLIFRLAGFTLIHPHTHTEIYSNINIISWHGNWILMYCIFAFTVDIIFTHHRICSLTNLFKQTLLCLQLRTTHT